MATLATDTTTIDIGDDLEWIDEFQWQPVTQNIRRTIGGSFIVEEASQTFGRPITLQGGENVWLLRSVFDQIITLASVPDNTLTLTLTDGTVFSVIFRRDEGNPHQAEPLWRKRIQLDADYVKNITLRFYTVTSA